MTHMCGPAVDKGLDIWEMALVSCSLVRGSSELFSHSTSISRLQSSTCPLSSLSIFLSVEWSIPKNKPRLIQLSIGFTAIIKDDK